MSVAELTGLNLTLSESPKTGFVATRPIFSISKTLSVGLMLRLDTATLDYRQTVAALTLEGFKVAYVRMEGKVNSK